MKADIDKFKHDNGNITYTVKELLYGIHTKLDRLEEKSNNNEKKIILNSWISKTALGMVLLLIGYLLNYVRLL